MRALRRLLAEPRVAQLRERGDRDGLLRALGDDDLRPPAARVLGELGEGRATRALLAVLADGAARGREEAALALGRVGAREAAAALEAALEDPDGLVGAAAADALVLLGRPSTPDPPLAAWERRAVAAVRDALGDHVATGAARLAVRRPGPPGPVIAEVTPRRRDACRIAVQLDLPTQVSVVLTPPTWFERWIDDEREYLAWIGAAVAAVARGDLEEWLHDDGRRAVGVLRIGARTEVFYDGIRPHAGVAGAGWRHRRAAPYGA